MDSMSFRVREQLTALYFDPQTARVSVVSDPIPQILEGISFDVRDIRVYVDRPNFTLNPTSCDPFSLTSTLTGSAAPFGARGEIRVSGRSEGGGNSRIARKHQSMGRARVNPSAGPAPTSATDCISPARAGKDPNVRRS